MDREVTAAGAPYDLATLLATGWRQRGFLLLVTGIVLAATVVYSFLLPPVYTAQVTILPEPGSSPDGLLGNLASIVGSGAGAEGSQEQLYGQILASDRILDRALDARWRHAAFAEPASLYAIFGVAAPGEADSAKAAEALKKILRNKAVSFRRDKATGYMVLKVEAPRDGAFAAELANFLAGELDRFNRESRSRRATEQHAFVSARLDEVEARLHEAEEARTDFQNRNRGYAASPELMQRFGELDREVQARTTIWVELRRQAELALIEMNKEKSSVDVLDRATPPVSRSQPRRGLYGAAGLLIGFAAAVVLAFLRHQVREFRRAAVS